MYIDLGGEKIKVRQIEFEEIMIAPLTFASSGKVWVHYPKYGGYCKLLELLGRSFKSSVVEANVQPVRTKEVLRVALLRRIPNGTPTEEENYRSNPPIFMEV